jgi:DnaJ-class molecular chaperone
MEGLKNGGGNSNGGGHHHHFHRSHSQFTDPNEIFRQFFGSDSIFDIMEQMMGNHNQRYNPYRYCKMRG